MSAANWMNDDVTDQNIRDLRHEAAIAGDAAQERLCARALDGSASARRECERVILRTRAEQGEQS